MLVKFFSCICSLLTKKDFFGFFWRGSQALLWLAALNFSIASGSGSMTIDTVNGDQLLAAYLVTYLIDTPTHTAADITFTFGRSGTSRSFLEFELLQRERKLGSLREEMIDLLVQVHSSSASRAAPSANEST